MAPLSRACHQSDDRRVSCTGMKKLRCSPSLLGGALAVVLSPQRSLWLDVQSALALACVCSAARQALRAWLEAAALDISLGKEMLPVPVRLPPSKSFHAKLRVVVELLTFTYLTAVRLPGGAMYRLPADLLSKHQRSDERCRRVLRGRQVEVVVVARKGKGWGVLAAQRIERGEYVGEYTGELVSTREMRRRYRERYDPHVINYVLSLREHVAQQEGASALGFDVVRTNMDASCSGSLTRFFNHSCAPSLDVAAVRVDSFVPRLAFFARERISAGDELTFDYGGGSSSSSSRSKAGGHPCRCGARECRGYLPSDVSE